MSNNKGFTLIELVIVIVILGILAATAAPKFIDLTGDARAAVIKGVEGSVNSAVEISHAKALIDGSLAETGDTITVGSDDITMTYGWPTADADGIELLVELSNTETDEGIVGSISGANYEFKHLDAPNPDNCKVVYDTSAADTEVRPAVTVIESGCFEDDSTPPTP